jgi:hypothetical protein
MGQTDEQRQLQIAVNIIKLEDGKLLYDKNDGEFNKHNALVILNAVGMADGMGFISQVLDNLYPSYKLLNQENIDDGDKVYSVFKITAKGKEHEVWFNITEFYLAKPLKTFNKYIQRRNYAQLS